MNVTCPECGSVFRVDPVKVPAGGTRARCAVCGGVMTVEAPAPFVGPTRPGRWATPAAIPAATAAVPTPRAATPVASPATAPPAPPAPATPHPTPAPTRAQPSPGRAVTPVPPEVPVPPHVPLQAPPQPPVPTPPSPAAPRWPTPAAVPVSAPRPTPAEQPALPQPAVVAPPAPGTPRPATPAPGGKAAPDAARPRPSGGRAINPFLANDPHQKAKRLARALVSDIVAYHPQLRDQALREGTLKHLFRDEIKKSYEEYVEQVGKEFADGTAHFQEALNDILAGGRRIF